MIDQGGSKMSSIHKKNVRHILIDQENLGKLGKKWIDIKIPIYAHSLSINSDQKVLFYNNKGVMTMKCI